MIQGPDYALLTTKGIIGSFYRRLEDSLEANMAGTIATFVASNEETERYRLLGMVPPMREWDGQRQSRPLRVDAFTITNKVYENTLHFDLDDWRRDKTAQMMLRAGELGARAAQHVDTLLTQAIEDTTTATYDNQVLFSASHSLGSSGTLSNQLTASDLGGLNVSDPDAPTADEFAEALVQLVQHPYTFKDDQGEPLHGGAREWAVMVSPNMMGALSAALSGPLRNSGSTSIVSTLPLGLRFVPIFNPRLSTTDVVYLFRVDTATRALIWQEELAPQVNMFGPGSETAVKENVASLHVKAVRAVGPGEPLSAIRATFS